MKKPLTVEKLARILNEEFDADGWGDIDPYLFAQVETLEKEGFEGVDVVEGCVDADALDLREVLTSVVERLNNE